MRNISLESIRQGDRPLGLEQQLDTIQACDQLGHDAVCRMGLKQEAIASMEAIGTQLKQNNGRDLGKVGAMFANVAIEGYCGNAGISMEDLPLDVSRFDRQPEAVIDSGVSAISALKTRVVSSVSDDLVELFGQLAKKREAYVAAMLANYGRIGEVERSISRFKGLRMIPRPSVTQFPLEQKHIAIITPERGLVAKGATVCPDLIAVLEAHSALFSSLIRRQYEWVERHKNNVLQGKEGMNQYSFNPAHYAIAGSDLVIQELADTKVRVGTYPLMGFRNLITMSCRSPLVGYDAADALASAKTWIVAGAVPSDLTAYQALTVLGIDDIYARIEELKVAQRALRAWCNQAYCTLWRDAMHSQQILKFVQRENANSLNERGLSLISQACLSLLNNAGADMAQYALDTISSLLSYVEDSVASYVNNYDIT